MLTASPHDRTSDPRFWYGVAAALVVAQVLVLWAMGRIWICDCGYIRLFEPGVNTSGNSQHLADWYTPSHILHGFLFYWLAHLAFRHRSLAFRFALAMLVEVAWEVLENTPMVIEHYRTATMAVGYTGDSILNSVMDSVFMALGFGFAALAPVWLTVVVAVIFEVGVALVIRDNLTLNVVMLIWPIEAIRTWQAAL
ncbi:DUF2585 domain-containing protein [Falsigemmobacter intermedius]|uniref:UPF0314 protein EP867_13045 n=1 Tax=Falsigemmobacter intermedius TaxID=1553448 RepID=A0A3S3YGE0_9RHOB|nr:DUF2585 domain-containing protein [Falsigemmobacter intermedius]RWY39902.1 DUF2585 domain-containing protein [Falsigemmobacter intermedius]